MSCNNNNNQDKPRNPERSESLRSLLLRAEQTHDTAAVSRVRQELEQPPSDWSNLHRILTVAIKLSEDLNEKIQEIEDKTGRQ